MNTGLRLTTGIASRRLCFHRTQLVGLLSAAHKISASRTVLQRPSTRLFSSSPSKRQSDDVLSSEKASHHVTEDPFVYKGPLTTAFRRLKIFSLSSFGLSVTLTPFLFVIESSLPMTARLALGGIALATSSISTTLVAWCARPYVSTLRRFQPDELGSAEEIEMTTHTLTLKPRITRVYDPSFLIETRRILAKWELADTIHLTENRTDAVGTNVHPEPGTEETVAETRNENGEVVGRWVVRWEENGKGSCHEIGKIVRHFNVHEELLE